jgi:hypothetical protein
MRLFVHRASSFCIFIALLATTASAAPPDFRESSRWVPSLGVTSGLLVEQHAEGEVASTVRPRADGSNSLVAPWLGADLEGMTPAWEPLGGRIRFFVHGGIAGNLGFERDLAKEGAPGAFVEPDLPLFGDEELVRGQGSVTRVEPTGLQASAGIGVSFTLDTEWRRIRIKPSFEYLLEEVEISGVVHRAVSVDPSIPSFDLIAISGTEDRSFHGIGPGLEVDTDIARTGPFLLALTASAGAYHILGDRDVVVSSTDATGTESAIWRYRKNAWIYRAQVGLRFRWAPRVDRSP